jgi:hypothetical protein
MFALKAYPQLSRTYYAGKDIYLVTENQILMVHKQRNKRLRLLISKLNKERKKQAKKIDMLCNDLIAAQRDFIRRLSTISFAADFYKSIIGITDLDRLLSITDKLIKDEFANINVGFFLRNADSVKSHISESDKPIPLERKSLQNYFTDELVANICKSNKLCSIDDMFAMGLQGNLIELSKISAYAIPLSHLGSPLGFMLVYRSLENKLSPDELNKISAITCGLSRAIRSCQALSHIGD